MDQLHLLTPDQFIRTVCLPLGWMLSHDTTLSETHKIRRRAVTMVRSNSRDDSFRIILTAATQNQSICQSINQPMIHKPLKIIYLGVNRTRTIIKICLTFSTSSWLYIKYSKCSPWARIIIVHFTFTNKHSTSCQKLTHLFEFTRCRLQSSYSVSFLPHLFTSQTDCLSSWTLNLLTITF